MNNWRNFYFLRHGQTDWNLEGRFQGQSDIPLNATGLKQAQNAAQLLKQYPIDRIISSPLDRAIKTADIVAKHTLLPVQIEDQLIERTFGSFEGLIIADVKRQHGIDITEPAAKILPADAEQWHETVERSRKMINRLLEELQHENVLFVAHHGIFRALTEIFCGVGLDSNNATPYEFQFAKDKWTPIEIS